MTPKEIRKAARESQARLAVKAGVSEPTLRLYETNPSAVTEAKRVLIDAVYKNLALKQGI